jgi:transcriptional regulator with XRE-family HTH domain
MQPLVKAGVDFCANDVPPPPGLALRMARPARIHEQEQPHRFHYIVEWADHRRLKQADITRELGVDKSTVSRWFKGALPSEMHLIALAGLFAADEPAALFRDPDDDWMARLLRGRTAEERQRVRTILEAALPPREAA